MKSLRAELPHEDFIYIADSGYAPYGERDDAHVIARSLAITAHLVAQDIKALVVACNTATAAAIHLLREAYPQLPIIGVEPALKPAVALSKTGRIGIMATRGTLGSNKFKSLLESQAGLADFVLQPCDGLADAIERSANTGDATETIAICDRYIRAMGQFGHEPGQIDTLVLGCTHYPFANKQLQALAGQKVHLLEPGDAVARQTRRLVANDSTASATSESGSGLVSLFTTRDPQALATAAQSWLGLRSKAQLLHI